MKPAAVNLSVEGRFQFKGGKSLINDAVAIFQAGADGLFIKPTGIDDPETRRLTRHYAPKLMDALILVVDRHIGNLEPAGKTYQTDFIEIKDEMTHLSKMWQAFRKR